MNQEILKKLNDLKRIGGITKEEILQGLEAMFPREKVSRCACRAIPMIKKISHVQIGTDHYQVLCRYKDCITDSITYFTENEAIKSWNELVKNKKKAKKVQHLSTRNGITRRDIIVDVNDERYPMPTLNLEFLKDLETNGWYAQGNKLAPRTEDKK